jgi:hypothetical protein
VSGGGFRGRRRPTRSSSHFWAGAKIFSPPNFCSPKFFHPARLDSKFKMLKKLAIWTSSKQGLRLKKINPINSTTFVLFDKYCPTVDQLGSKDSSRDFQLNCVKKIVTFGCIGPGLAGTHRAHAPACPASWLNAKLKLPWSRSGTFVLLLPGHVFA